MSKLMKKMGFSKQKETEPPNQQESSLSYLNKEPELRIVLVGKSGGGKSAAGNTILRENRFQSMPSQKPVTSTCSRAERTEKWMGKRIVVIDTPAIFDTHVEEPWNSQEIQKCLSLCGPGPHALVFVMKAGRFTEEDNVALKRVEKIFGREATKYMTVLFTRKEDIDSKSLDEYVWQSGNKDLQDLVRKCQKRCCAFNNKATGKEMIIQAEELLSQIEKMVQENQDKPHLQEPPRENKSTTSQGASEDDKMDTEDSSGGCEKKDPKKANEEPGSVSCIHKHPEIRIVLVGKTGGGKSATGNTILGEKKFESKLSQQPVTKSCSSEVRAASWKGNRILVINTPAIFDSSMKEPQKSQETRKCLSLSGAGPHALVFVTQVGRFTKEDSMAVKRVEEIFGKEATKKMVVLFTRKEDIDTGSLEEHIWCSGNSPLQDLVRKCENRCCAFNNKVTGKESALQAEELLSKVEKVVRENWPHLPLGRLSEKTTEEKPQEDEMDLEEGPRGCWEKGPKGTERSDEGEPGSVSCIHKHPEIRIVLVGKTGGGKSATGNTILGEKKFESKLSQQPVTKSCSSEVRAASWKGNRILVINTPAIFDSSMKEPQKSQETRKCLSLSGAGPHALVFVTQVGRFTKEDSMAVKRVEEIFGKEATKKMVVLFTRKEDIDTGSLEEHIWCSGNSPLQDLVRKCENRCCAFNNKVTGKESALQAEELLSKVEKVVRENWPHLPLGRLSEKTTEEKPQEDEMDLEEGPRGCWEKGPKGTERSDEGGIQHPEELPRKMKKM